MKQEQTGGNVMRRWNTLEGVVLHHQAGAETSTPEDLDRIGAAKGHHPVLVYRWEYEGEEPRWAPWTASEEAVIHADYHACIDLEGIRHRLLPWHLMGSHCSAGRGNYRFIGFCLLGNREIHDIPTKQWGGAVVAIARVCHEHNIPATAVRSHHEVEVEAGRANPTLCPGLYVRDRMEEFRQAVRDTLPDRHFYL